MVHERGRRVARLGKIQLAVAEVDRLVLDSPLHHRAYRAVACQRRLLPVGRRLRLRPNERGKYA